MSYRYEAASASQRSRRQATTQQSSAYSPSYTYSAAGSSAAGFQSSTSERWHALQSPAAQGPAIYYSPAPSTASPKGVRFATPNDLSSPYLNPGRSARTGGSPLSPDSLYMYSPHTPSLSHTTPDFEDDVMECPDTPLLKPRALEPDNEPSLFSPNSSVYASHYEIDCVLHELNSLVRSYHLPTELDFEPAPNVQSAPTLSYTAKNRPFLEHNQKLEKLQSRLDAIQSYGNEDLRKARKAANAKVEHALNELKRVQAMLCRQWAKQRRV